MKHLFIVANWKSNKAVRETEKWLHDFNEGFGHNPFSLSDKEVIVAPSFISLEHANYCFDNLKLPIKLAAQNISPFDEGAYTGEVSAKQIKELAKYVIIGHSERRQNFGESDQIVNQKTEQALRYDLIPILCVSNIQQIQKSKFKNQNDRSKLKNKKREMIVAYEPLFAIGSGKPDSSENADEMGKKIKEILGEVPVLYGGSVASENVKSFTQMSNIDGVLVGGASLDPLEFLEIIKNA